MDAVHPAARKPGVRRVNLKRVHVNWSYPACGLCMGTMILEYSLCYMPAFFYCWIACAVRNDEDELTVVVACGFSSVPWFRLSCACMLGCIPTQIDLSPCYIRKSVFCTRLLNSNLYIPCTKDSIISALTSRMRNVFPEIISGFPTDICNRSVRHLD